VVYSLPTPFLLTGPAQRRSGWGRGASAAPALPFLAGALGAPAAPFLTAAPFLAAGLPFLGGRALSLGPSARCLRRQFWPQS
jgi:hypothetical protein